MHVFLRIRVERQRPLDEPRSVDPVLSNDQIILHTLFVFLAEILAPFATHFNFFPA